MEVSFMAEKQTFVQIVDMETGIIDKIVNLKEIEAMTPEEKLALARNKNLFIVSHRLEPIVRVTMKRSMVTEPMQFGNDESEKPVEEEPKSKAKSTSTETKPRRKK